MGAANTADATAMTMILLLVRIIEQVANEARVLQIKNMLMDDKTIKKRRKREREKGTDRTLPCQSARRTARTAPAPSAACCTQSR